MVFKKGNMYRNKAKVKLIYPAQSFTKDEGVRPDSSLGLLYIAGMLRNHGISVSLLDMLVGEKDDDLKDTFFRRKTEGDGYIRVGMSEEILRERLHGYNIVGISSNYTSQTNNALDVARICKELNPDILTVAGGWNATALYTLFLENDFDLVVLGEGEKTMLEIVKHFEHGEGYHTIPNVAYKDQCGTIQVNPKRPALTNLDLLPVPAWDLLPLSTYWEVAKPQNQTFFEEKKMRFLPMQTSRGCPFRCTYCHNSKAADAATLRIKSHDRVMFELDMIQRLGAEYVFFNDDSLLARRDRVHLLHSLKNEKLKFCALNGINVCNLFCSSSKRDLDIDYELLKLMKESGFLEVGIGFESGSQRIIDKYANKKWNHGRHDVLRLVNAMSKHDIKTLGFFTIGYPDETLHELSETFIFARDLVQAGLNDIAFNIVSPLPGTALYDLAAENGNLPTKMHFERLKQSVPQMVHTLIPPEVLQYTRRLIYSLLTS